MDLRLQDIPVALALASGGDSDSTLTYPDLARKARISPSEAHASFKRLRNADLVSGTLAKPAVHLQDLYLFLVHALRHICPPRRGTLTRGMPTAYAAPPLNAIIAPSSDPPPVWPTPDGPVRGIAFEPLYRTTPQAAAADPKLYELLALCDALRDGRVRERRAAAIELAKRLGVPPAFAPSA